MLAAWAAAAAATMTLAACGTVSAPAGAPARPGPARVDLSFRFSGRPGHPAVHGSLRCEPTGGTVPDAATACRVLLGMKHSPVAPVAKRTICPMIMAGDGQIVLTGRWFGKPVHRVVADGGCDLTLFGVLAKILR
jgi:hypothetical protein